MAKGAAKTGGGPTIIVAIEQFLPDEQIILKDSYARITVPYGMRSFVSLMRFRCVRDWMIRRSEYDMPGIWAGILLRKKYIDEKLITSLSEIKSIVNLGAGSDTRAFRLPQLEGKPFFELDQPNNIKAKQSQIEKSKIKHPDNLRLVAIDFDKENISEALQRAGYLSDMPTFFIWEGVSQYLTYDGILSTFKYLSNAPGGSKLAFTYVRRDFIEGSNRHGNEKVYDKFVVKDKIWLFGMNPEEWPMLLTKHGWKLVDDISADQIYEKYIKSTKRTLMTSPIERIAFAEKI